MRLRSPAGIAAVAALIVALAALGYWSHAGYKKRELHRAVVSLVGDATARIRDALGVRGMHAEALERLEDHFKAVTAATQRLAQLELRRDPLLAEGAQRYLDEAQALLRRKVAVQRSGSAARAGADALADHMRAARGRSADWIRQAIALKQQMEKDFFDYRLAAGGLQKSLQSMREARTGLAPLLAELQLTGDEPIAEARAWLEESSAQLQRQVEAARTLPIPR